MTNAFGFGKEYRILKRSDFIRLGKKGNKIHTAGFIAVYMENSLLNSRLGITITKKIAKANRRNRLKRKIREYFRRNKHRLFFSLDINIIGKKALAGCNERTAEESIQQIFSKIFEVVDH